eukprot:scaffold20577_cov62-Phaeocystis_antarctica.AAC.2
MTAKLTPCTAKPMSETPSGSYRRVQYNRETRSEPTSTRGCNARDGDEPWRGLADAVGHLGVARWPCRSSTDGEPQVEELQDERPVRERRRAEGDRCCASVASDPAALVVGAILLWRRGPEVAVPLAFHTRKSSCSSVLAMSDLRPPVNSGASLATCTPPVP